MSNEEYKKYEDLVEHKYKGKRSINSKTVGNLKNARDSLRKLNQAIADCYKNEDGEKQPIGAERLKKLQACYKECLENVNIARQKISKTDILNTIYEVLKKDSRTVHALQEDSFFPEYFRRDVVSFEKMPVKPVGGALSERIPVEYRSEDGTLNTGFFTKESYFENNNAKQALEKVAKNKDARNPYGPLLSEIIKSNKIMDKVKLSLGATNFIQALNERITDNNLSLKDEITELNKFLGDWGVKTALKVPESMEDELSDVPRPGSIVSQFVSEYFVDGGMNKLQDAEQAKNGLYKKAIGIKKGDNITDRNCAMTEIANLLGRGDLLAKSVPMEICYRGTKQKGIFMENAEGETLDDVIDHPESLHLGKMTPAAMKDIADIQIIDYICGNIDRHLGNMIYQFDEDGNLAHIKGIDHDLSMGNVKEDLRHGRQWLPKIKNMYVISETMARRIQNVRPEQMMMMLSALELPDGQKELAWARVEVMKKFIANAKHMETGQKLERPMEDGKLRIVPENAWGNVKVDALIQKTDIKKLKSMSNPCERELAIKEIVHHNIFSNMCFVQQELTNELRNHKREEKRNVRRKPKRSYNQGSIVSPAFFPAAVQHDADAVKTLFDKLKETIGKDGLAKRGKEFKQMHSAVEELSNWYGTNKAKKEWTSEEKKNLNQLYQNTVTQCELYIRKHNPYSTIGKQRQNVAVDLLEFMGVRGMEIDQFCLQMKRIPEEQMNRLLGRETALDSLEALKNKEALTDEEKKNAMQLMAIVIKVDLENGLQEQVLKERLQFGPEKKAENLMPDDIRRFVNAEAEEFGLAANIKLNQLEEKLGMKKNPSQIEAEKEAEKQVERRESILTF